MTTKYDQHGNEYETIMQLPNGSWVARPVYEDPNDGEPTWSGDPEVIGCTLFDEPPRAKVDAELAALTAKVAAARAELEGLRRDIRQTALDSKARLAKLAQYDQLKRLEDFLDGKITHYVMADYGPPTIMTLAESKSEYSDRDLRLLCLFGTTNRSLVWKLNRYNDGSGCYSYVFPCCSFEEAKQTADKIFADHFAGKSVDGDATHPQRGWLDAADKIGIAVPEAYRAAVVSKEAESRANEIKRLQAKLAELTA
jgi:hypothetical protein